MEISTIKSKGLDWEYCQYRQAVIDGCMMRGITFSVSHNHAISDHFMNAEPVGTCVAFIARMND